MYLNLSLLVNGLGSCAGTLGAIPCCFCCPNPYKSIPQGQVGLITRFGEFQRSCDPGLQKVNPFSEKLRLVDIKIQIQGIPTQNLMTRDNVSVAIDSVLYYHIINPFKAAFGISSVSTALTERAMTTLRSVSNDLLHLLSSHS
jgi:erythrocyte band 7 integral membrane protein